MCFDNIYALLMLLHMPLDVIPMEIRIYRNQSHGTISHVELKL